MPPPGPGPPSRRRFPPGGTRSGPWRAARGAGSAASTSPPYSPRPCHPTRARRPHHAPPIRAGSPKQRPVLEARTLHRGVRASPPVSEVCLTLSGIGRRKYRCGHSVLTYPNRLSIQAWWSGCPVGRSVHDRAGGHELAGRVRAHLRPVVADDQHRDAVGLGTVQLGGLHGAGAQPGEQPGIEPLSQPLAAQRVGEGDLNLGAALLG